MATKKWVLFLTSILLANLGFAWDYNLSLGYGRSKEAGLYYYQQLFMLDGQASPFAKIDKTLNFGLGATLVNWHVATKEHSNMTAAAASVIFRAYFVPPKPTAQFRPYLTVSFGPACLFNRQLGERKQGGPFAFLVTMGGGSEIKIGKREFDLSLKLVHCSNGGMYSPNQGIDVWCVLSIGYLI